MVMGIAVHLEENGRTGAGDPALRHLGPFLEIAVRDGQLEGPLVEDFLGVGTVGAALVADVAAALDADADDDVVLEHGASRSFSRTAVVVGNAQQEGDRWGVGGDGAGARPSRCSPSYLETHLSLLKKRALAGHGRVL